MRLTQITEIFCMNLQITNRHATMRTVCSGHHLPQNRSEKIGRFLEHAKYLLTSLMSGYKDHWKLTVVTVTV